ncbi:uncharacterized protein LOC110187664 [Drosophila serrata]|uniref:uncharacterized protein LOC110187664 n=1 Tax=Drosophila serrata TaxID=7274 RepID=UPI000A1D0955|nr:uncharacterized protein LOC110187664 [Drosophila serrata]
MESTKENDASVLAPSQEDAIAAQTSTPVANKTRRALRKRMDSTVDESVLHPGPPKTPGTPGSRTLGSETPRRSCRKSVRPPIDYEDIVRSAKKLIPDDVDDQEEEEQTAVQKWKLAEVGRSTRKRNRKSKRLAGKKPKTEQDEPESTGIDSGVKDAEAPIEESEDKLEQSAVEETQAEKNLEHLKDVKEMQPENKLDQSVAEEMQTEDKLEHLKDVKEMQPENKLDQSEAEEMQTEDKLEHLKDVKKIQPEDKLEQSEAKELQPEVTGLLPDIQDGCQKPQHAGDVVEKSELLDSKSKNKASSRKSSRVSRKANTPAAATAKKKRINNYKHIVGDEDIEDLGLTPLEDPGEKTLLETQLLPLAFAEEFGKKRETMPESTAVTERVIQEEEMPLQPLNDVLLEDEEMASLIMLDDDDEAEKPTLNTTFDADDIKQEDQSVILLDSPIVHPVSEGQKSSIKVVLTTTDDKTETLLNLEHASQKPKGYPFATPFTTKVNFSDFPEPSGSNQNKLEAEPRYGRRRSKSASQLDDTMSRTVTFRSSPIEIVSVVDIDNRWKEANNTNNVTNRRRRSKSLDERKGFTSRLPKPRIQPLPKPKPVTPSQVKKRTKLPDFSALHQKEFAKMESLVDHVERKAERAKILTTSALKKPLGSAAKQAQSSTSAAERSQGPRPKASKKIDLAADRSVVAENPDKKLPPSRLPLKSALNVTAVPRPAFNLSTATAKSFNATICSKSAESQKDKLVERRQRHMDMFKGRAATKGQDKKSEFIRGVRLNRRFELQMQHRKHLEED